MYDLKNLHALLNNESKRRKIYNENMTENNIRDKGFLVLGPTLQIPSNQFGVLGPGSHFSDMPTTIAGRSLFLCSLVKSY